MAFVSLKGKLTLNAPFCRIKDAPPPHFEFRLENKVMNAPFEASLISPDENYRIIRVPPAFAGSIMTHLGLMLAHQCFSVTGGFLFTYMLVKIYFCIHQHHKHG